MRFLSSLTGILLIGLASFAQSPQTQTPATQNPNRSTVPVQTAPPDPSLAGQFREIYSRSKTFNDHKLVRSSRLTSFYQSVTDSLKAVRRQLADANARLKAQDDSISSLSEDVSTREKNLAAAQARVDEVNFFGLGMSKTNYQLMMWGIVLILAVALIIVIGRIASLKRLAAEKVGSYDELAEEHRLYKVKAAEKEKKLARELQDERNKLEELQARKK